MLVLLRRLALGLFLIAAASAVLLFSDLRSRAKKPTASARPSDSGLPAPGSPLPAHKPRVALLQHSSQMVLDQLRQGVLDGMAERGWPKEAYELAYFNAEGDMPVAQAIAQRMASGGYDLLLSISTPSLQAVAAANREGRTPHLFAGVTLPSAAGVGISATDPLDHPAHLAGYGTMQPVARSFEIALKLNPSLKTVGTLYNAAESNAEAQMKLARAVCQKLGLTLLETTVENSAGVSEAANAVISRGAEAVWVCGDTTVLSAVDTVVAACRKGGVPLFTVIPPNAKKGGLFDVGANYTEVGHLVGHLAGEVLSGTKKPADLPVLNVVPETLVINLRALAGLKPGWSVPADLRAAANLLIDENGSEIATPKSGTGVPPVSVEASRLAAAADPASASPSSLPALRPLPKPVRITTILYSETAPAEETLAGMKSGWTKSRLVAGRDYELKLRSAQGDIATLGAIYDAALTEGADLIVPLSTPSLQAAVRRVKDRPVVFTMIANPVAAGAGKSFTDHLPNITGVAVLAPIGEMLDLLARHYPRYRRIGTLFCPAEANSVDVKDALAAACKARGTTLETVAANTATELPDAAASLASLPIDAIVQVSDNLSSAGFTSIANAARRAQKPLFSLNSATVPLGAPLSMGRDYFAVGEHTVAMIEQVIAGTPPAQIPFLLPPTVKLTLSPAHARAIGMELPPALLKEGKVVE
jgi:ABC-type uncharacterized transport system substrate-binding protein